MASSFVSWDSAVSLQSAKLLPKLQSDCESCCKARRLEASSGSGEYSGGDTNWLAANATPRCLLEQLAASILWAHAGKAETFDRLSSGAEWWTLHIDADDEVGLHWDKDYGQEAESGDNITPWVATVTYLSEVGAPTFTLPRSCPERVGEPLDDGTPVRRGFLSFPKPGKHMSFPGSWLHGAPTLGLPEPPCGSADPKLRRRRQKRVSLLVNVWLGRKPLLAAPLPEALLSRLSPCLAKPPFELGQPTPALTLSTQDPKLGGEGAAKREFSWTVAQEGDCDCELVVTLPIEQLAAAVQRAPGLSIELAFGFNEVLIVETVSSS